MGRPTTVGKTGAAGVLPPSLNAVRPPTLVTIPSAPARQRRLFGYQIDATQRQVIGDYLKSNPVAGHFVRSVANIIDGVYGAGVTRTLCVLDDLDTGSPIMELTVYSFLPSGATYAEKDARLFREIEEKGLADGLQYVVLSQG